MPGATIKPKSDCFEIAREYLSPQQYQLIATTIPVLTQSVTTANAKSWYCLGLRYHLAISKLSLFGFMVAPGI